MRCSIGGWVKNNLVNQLPARLPLNGEEINKWAVELLALRIGLGSLDIFSKALANPSGYLVKSPAEASAKNSRFLEIAN